MAVTRSRVQPVAGAAAQTAADTSGGWLTRGRAGVQKAEDVQREREERRNNPSAPFDFVVAKGGEREVIILESTLDDVPFIWEHEVWTADQGGEKVLVPCVKEFANCAVCERAEGNKSKRFKSSYYAAKLTCLDLSGYDKKDDKGNVIEHDDTPRRRSMTIKSGQLNDFVRLHDACVKEHGTMRGMYLVMARDRTDTAPRIGKPIVQENGRMYQLYSEDVLINDFGHDAIMSKREPDKVIVEENGNLEPFEWGKLYPKPDPEAIRRKWGTGAVAPGSKEDVDAEWGEGDQPETQAPAAAANPRRRAPVAQQPAAQEQTQAASTPAVRQRAAPAAAPAATQAAATKPAQGGTRAGVTRRTGGASSGRTTIADDLDDNIPF